MNIIFDKIEKFVKENWPYILAGAIILGILLYFGDTALIDANLND